MHTVANMSVHAGEHGLSTVIGTKDELEERGIVQHPEGGSRFLFVLWKTGVTLTPARHLDPSGVHARSTSAR